MAKIRKSSPKTAIEALLKKSAETLDLSSPREKHSNLFFKQGENLLLKGDRTGIDFFDYAASLDPSNVQLMYEMALALTDFAEHQGKREDFLLANKKFKCALKNDPNHFPSLHGYALNLYTLGIQTEEFHYFLEAKEKFQKALEVSDAVDRDLLYDLYTQFGSNMLEIALHSEEICDFNIALDLYNQAKAMYPSHSSEFWYEFGRICVELSRHIEDDRLLIQAIDCFSLAVKLNKKDFDHWFLLGTSLSKLYESTHDEDHFSRANECLSSAAKINPKEGDLWLAWSRLLLKSGRRLRDTKRLHAAIEKCQTGYPLLSDPSLICANWSEALATLGIIDDHIDLLHEAENKMIEIIEHYGSEPETLHAYGYCLYGFGRYFNSVDYYYQAIEKFQEGLSIDRTYDELWYAMGKTYAVAGALENDEEMLKQSLAFFKKAIHFNPLSTYLFEMGLAFLHLSELDHSKLSLQMALYYFEKAISKEKNTVYLHPDWLFEYAVALDAYGDQAEDEMFYVKAIEILSHVLVTDPDHPEIHHKIGLVYSHYAELALEKDLYRKALFHYQLAYQHNEENDILLLDWGLCLINYSEALDFEEEKNSILNEAEYKMIQSAKLGNIQAFYHLACLYSIKKDLERAMYFIVKAKEFEALPNLDDIVEDAWLENLRSTEDFSRFLSALETKVEEEL